MNKKKTVIGVIVGILLLLILGAAGFVTSKLNRIQRAEEQERIPREEETFETDEGEEVTAEVVEEAPVIQWNGVEILQSDKVKNILFIGQDRRPGQGRQRSDSMIICSIQEETNELILTSVMRDCYVQIPGYSDNRINAAYAFGGMELLDETIELNFGIHIDGNLEVDFDGFIEALSAVGNLDIELNAAEVNYFNKQGWGVSVGVNSLNPERVLSYARTRYVGHSDWERTERQRKVITAAFRKVQYCSLPEILELVDEILPCVTTDLKNTEIIGYVYQVVMNNMTDLRSQRVPIDGAYRSARIRGMSVLVPDLTTNNEYLKETIYEVGKNKGE
ncbi:MAG: LCP family protein [Lachnospiraceae bacterium]